MPASIALGNDNFRNLRETGAEYVDKSALISDIINDISSTVLLLPRPRRFGKTLNLRMLEAWFAKSPEDLSRLFEGLTIWSAGDKYRAHFQRYPTLYLSFKNLKPKNEAHWNEGITGMIGDLYSAHSDLLNTGNLRREEKKEFNALISRRASGYSLENALKKLTEWLERAHGEKVLVLIDEYDTPVHAAWTNGCYTPVVDFYRSFFGAALKDNPALFKGVLTGILRISKESVFSDLNNLVVATVLDPEFSTAFGFTEDEVRLLCERQLQVQHLPVIQAWYNGYLFGGRVIYNPWSVLSFLKSQDKSPRPHWLASSANELIKQLLTTHAFGLHELFQSLLEGKAVIQGLKPGLVFPELLKSSNALFNLLVFSGYLKAEPLPHEPMYKAEYALTIPNLEVREIFATVFSDWLEQGMDGEGQEVANLTRAIMEGDAKTLQSLLSRLALNLMSYHDRGRREPESFGHGLMLGLCAALEPKFRVRSNRESGTGRPDLLILPTRPGQPGAVLEIKAAGDDDRPLQAALDEALHQIEVKQYAEEVRASGASLVREWAIAFDGKTVKVVLAGTLRA